MEKLSLFNGGNFPSNFSDFELEMNDSPSIDGKAYYSIQLQGALDQNWADQFGDLKAITFQAKESFRSPVTTIVGEVFDQAALLGLLNLVYDLGLPLLSVTYLGRRKLEVP